MMEGSGRKEDVPTLAVNGGLLEVTGTKGELQQATVADVAGRQAVPGPSSLDLGRCVAFNSTVLASSPRSHMHKCRSLPRIPAANPAALGSPRIQIAASMLSTSDLMLDTDQLSIAGNVGLLRSMSARTVDSLIHMDRSLASSNSGSRFLSPCGDKMDNLAARSTSCPSMAYPMITCRSGSHFQLRHHADDRDVNLDGEEITDLPIEPTQNFPDLIPELREDFTPDSHNGNLPLYADICDEGDGAAAAEDSGDNNNDKSESQGPREVEASVSTSSTDRQRMDGNFNVSAREKCIRWLKSLSVDKS